MTFKEPAASSQYFYHLYSRGDLLSSKGGTLPCPRPTPSALNQPETLSLWIWETVRLLSLRVMEPSLYLSSHTCSRARMDPQQLRTRVRSQFWSRPSRATPQKADSTYGWSSTVLSRRAYPTRWTSWNPPYMSQMWFLLPRKHPWTHSLTMAPTEAQATRRDAERSSQEGERKDLSCSQTATFVCFQETWKMIQMIQTSRLRRLPFCR